MERARNDSLRLGAVTGAQPSACGAALGDEPASATLPNSAITAVFLQLLPRIASLLPRNEVACVLRLVCKAAAATLRGPQHATVHLSEPVPTAEFRWRWCGPQSLRSTTRKQRQQLELLTARSGVVVNLEALEARGDLPFLSLPAERWGPLLAAASGACRLELCRWLHERRGVGASPDSLNEAARYGHTDVCEWLMDCGCEWDFEAVRVAVKHGHVRLAERLLELKPQAAPFNDEDARLVEAAAHGCELATLQRLHEQHVASRGMDPSALWGCAAAAACSPTPDWAAKVEWLEGLGCPRASSAACTDAARYKEGAASRLAWLHERGYALEGRIAASAAAEASNVEALRYMLAQGVQLGPHDLSHLAYLAHASGCLEAAQLVWDAGGRPNSYAVAAAAERGHLHVVAWAAAQLGEGMELSARLFRAGAESGSLPLVRWLHEHGCPWDAGVHAVAAEGGSEGVLDWLSEHGCPMGEDGQAYEKAAAQLDLPTLRCLVRLGCPFARSGRTFTAVAGLTAAFFGCETRPLQLLLDAGCPVDWDAVVLKARRWSHGLAEWLQEQRRQRASSSS